MDWLEWSRRQNRNVLEHIVALLLALAALAEHAASATGWRRKTVLAILGHAEAEARAFVIAMAHESSTPSEPLAVASTAHGQAEGLAARFRALALMLSAMLALARRFVRPGAAGPHAGLPRLPRRFAEQKRRRWIAALPVFDTS